jgi:hypothetical protein
MIFHDVEQNSEEWFSLRTGKVTTSKLGVFMANYGKAFTDTAKKYAFRIAKEQVTGERVEETAFMSEDMKNGQIYEPIAREEYEYTTFNNVGNGGFCQHEKYSDVGGSPDGLILDQNGGIEIKSVKDWTHRNNIRRGTFDPAYKWQVLGNIWLCGLDWLDFISYGITYTRSKKLFIYRAYVTEYQEQIDMIEPRLNDFRELIESEKKYL